MECEPSGGSALLTNVRSDELSSTSPYEEQLSHLPPERRDAVRAFLAEVVAECPHCGATVTRTSSRGLDADGALGCLACVTQVVGQCTICRGDMTRQHKTVRAAGGQAHDDCAKKR